MTKKNRDQDVEFIQSLAKLLNQNELTELEVSREYGETDKINVRVSKSGSPQAYQVATQQPSMAPAIAPMPQEGSSDQNINDPVSHPGAVTSPMAVLATAPAPWRAGRRASRRAIRGTQSPGRARALSERSPQRLALPTRTSTSVSTRTSSKRARCTH